MEPSKNFEDLLIFQKARQLNKEVYAATDNAPWTYDVRFVQQIHAAAGSIMDNIAEGYERDGNKEFINFLYFAKGSCGEVRSQLLRANDVGFIDEETFKKLYSEARALSISISRLIYKLKTSEIKGTKYK